KVLAHDFYGHRIGGLEIPRHMDRMPEHAHIFSCGSPRTRMNKIQGVIVNLTVIAVGCAGNHRILRPSRGNFSSALFFEISCHLKEDDLSRCECGFCRLRTDDLDVAATASAHSDCADNFAVVYERNAAPRQCEWSGIFRHDALPGKWILFGALHEFLGLPG